MSSIFIRDLHLGGIAPSKWNGPANAVAQTVGLDLHSEPGLIKVNQQLINDTLGTVTLQSVLTSMTSSTGKMPLPFVAKESSYSSSVHRADQCFDGDDASYSQTLANAPGWISLDMGYERTIYEVDLFTFDVAYYPTNLEIQYSHDDVIWYTVKSVIGHTDWATSQNFTFNPTLARYWRILVNTTLVPGRVGFKKIDFKEATHLNIGNMVSNTYPSPYVISASSIETGFDAYKGIDGSNITAWASNPSFSTPEWLKVNLGSAKKIDNISIKCNNLGPSGHAAFPKDFLIQYSNDDSAWTTVVTETGLTSDDWNPTDVYDFRNYDIGGVSAQYWRVYITAITSDGDTLQVHISDMVLNEAVTLSASIADNIVKILPCTDGNIYLFGGTTGKIYKRAGAGIPYVEEATNAKGGMFDAIEDQGYIYYCSATHVGRWQIGQLWSTRDDDWAAFTNGSTDFHPMIKQNLTVYIGDDNLVAQVENGVFTPNALDIKTGLKVKSLGLYDTDLLVGTYVDDNLNKTEIYNWNTYSQSFTTSDSIPEVGINSFFATDNNIIVNAGKKGNLYAYNGGVLQQFKKINGDWSLGNQAEVQSNAVANMQGIPLFGVSNITGNPCKQGIYSIGSNSAEYPVIMNLEHVVSCNQTEDLIIECLAYIDDLLFVSWKNNTTYGVDRLDWTTKASGSYFESMLMSFKREPMSYIQKIYIYYADLPENNQIKLYASVNHEDYEELDLILDTDRKCYYTKDDIPDVFALQLKLLNVVSVNESPQVEAIEIVIKDQ